MINISFDKPYLLLLAIPLLALVLVPAFIAIRRENRTKSVIATLVIHLLLVALVTLVAAGMLITTVMTETHVLVLADASYSAEGGREVVEAAIRDVEKALPRNAKMGVVAFGRDQRLVTPMGEAFTGLSDSGVDSSGTDIKAALEYAGSFFPEGVVKRIVLITDGAENCSGTLDGAVGVVDSLIERGFYVDAVYLDSNLTATDREVQISGVDVTASTYLNHEATADVLLQSAAERTDAVVTLTRGDAVVATQYVTLTQGFNVLSFALPTDAAGSFDYCVTVKAESAEGTADVSSHNNVYTFTQAVSGKLHVLLVTGNVSDEARARELYGEEAVIDVYYNNPDVPCTVETLIPYDEILLSDVDVRGLNNVNSFLSCLDTVVSRYGKSLVTFGDTKIQNQTDETLKTLEDMLPVRFGNSDQDAKLVCLVIDTSRSMEFVEKLHTAKAAAKQLVSILNDHDSLIIISFSGDYTQVLPSSPVGGNRERINQLIDGLQPTQGTVLGKAMNYAKEKTLESTVDKKQLFLISDGRTWSSEEESAVTVAEELLSLNISTSVLNTGTKPTVGDDAAGVALQLLRDIATKGGGNYYYAASPRELSDIMLTDIANDITETVIEGDIPLNVRVQADRVLSGIETALPHLGGYVYSKPKGSATTVLTADFTTTSGKVTEAPIYSYWSYGKGQVSTFTSSLSGAWVEQYQAGNGHTLFLNMLAAAVPREKLDHPFLLDMTVGTGLATLTVSPETLRFDAVTTVTVTLPDGSMVTETVPFNTQSYVYEFPLATSGKYAVAVTYAYANRSYEASSCLHIPYTDEYDSFHVFSVATLHKLLRQNGTVYTDSSLITLENREGDVATYTVSPASLFMIVAVVLFVADIIIRKLRLADILNLFGLRERRYQKKKGGNKV